MKQTYLSYFLGGFKTKASVMHEHVMINSEHVMNAYENLRILKHIKGI